MREVIVAIEADVEASQRNLDARDLLNLACSGSFASKLATGNDADECEVFASFVALDDLMRDAFDSTRDGDFVHDDRFG